MVHKGLQWLAKLSFLTETEEIILEPGIIDILVAHNNLHCFKALKIRINSSESLEWLPELKSFNELEVLHVYGINKFHPPPKYVCFPEYLRLREIVLDIDFIPTVNDLFNTTDVIFASILKSVLRSEVISKMVLPSISRETMAGIHSILLHCPSLTSLELKRTRLGYDGILYICSSLRNNTALRRLAIHDDLQLPPSVKSEAIVSFRLMKSVPIPSKTSCTDFLLELNNILKDNTTLEEIKIKSGLFLPLSAGGDGEYCQWTGLGHFQQFNVGAVASGRSPNLRRSFSSSDLTQPHTTLFWYQKLLPRIPRQVDFKRPFFKKTMEGKKLFSRPSFTAPDTEVLYSFSALDYRLKECLGIYQIQQSVERLRKSYFAD